MLMFNMIRLVVALFLFSAVLCVVKRPQKTEPTTTPTSTSTEQDFVTSIEVIDAETAEKELEQDLEDVIEIVKYNWTLQQEAQLKQRRPRPSDQQGTQSNRPGRSGRFPFTPRTTTTTPDYVDEQEFEEIDNIAASLGPFSPEQIAQLKPNQRPSEQISLISNQDQNQQSKYPWPNYNNIYGNYRPFNPFNFLF